MDQNIDSSGFDQIQPPQYPAIHHPSQEINEVVLQVREKFMKDTKTFLEKFSRISFRVMPTVLSIAWERFFEINHAYIYKRYKPEKIQELMCKLCEDVRNIREELSEYINSPSWNYPTFYNDEEHSVQYKEYLEKYPDAITPVLPKEEPEYSLSMGYDHLSTTPEIESEEVTESSVKNLVPILSEYEVTPDDESECDMPIKDDSSLTFTTFSNPLSNDNDNFTSRDDESLLDEDVSIEEFKEFSGELTHINPILPEIKEADFDLEEEILEDNDSLMDEIDLFRATDELLPLNIKCDSYDSEGDIHFHKELLIDDSIPFPNNELSNFDHQDDPLFPRPPPEPLDVEFFFNSKPDVIAEEILDKLNEHECFDPGGEIDVFANVEDDDYFPFIFVIRIFLSYLIYPEVSSLLLSADNEDTIFNPGISV
uniref:Reverse transcriptase domain-containing protein n=1 Tax=Tanacetum cinerariifolium TaxID=118510 RepID=A0A6L2KX98_TANCI|nr:hypothetical protein [Tanacetum cinerariifolium]